ncbi:MAG: sigma-70 family RNA polymerase sigma factor [Candidatus Zixiibacteriota bacterium]
MAVWKRAKYPIEPLTQEEHDELEVRRLVAAIKQGRRDAFSLLVRRYRSQVAALAYKIVGDYDEAADITQTVFVKMAANIWRYDDSKKFYTWLYRVTVNASIDHLRKIRRHRHEPLENVYDVVESRAASPETAFRRQQLDGYIQQAANTLNDKQRSAFMLRDVGGCRVDDVATIMNMPEATVRWYLHRARAKIRKELLKRCPQLLIALGIK